ncbi:MAG: hypothetical protein M5U18_14000 [Dehalococcoidia bacterium]|nr:hypothetical protein [Dehalococcoidia bacterium]
MGDGFCIEAVALTAAPCVTAAECGEPPVDVVHHLTGMNQADGQTTPVAARTFNADLARSSQRAEPVTEASPLADRVATGPLAESMSCLVQGNSNMDRFVRINAHRDDLTAHTDVS